MIYLPDIVSGWRNCFGHDQFLLVRITDSDSTAFQIYSRRDRAAWVLRDGSRAWNWGTARWAHEMQRRGTHCRSGRASHRIGRGTSFWEPRSPGQACRACGEGATQIKHPLQQALRTAFLALVVLDLILTYQHVLSPSSAAALEGLALLIGGVQVWRAHRAHRQDRSSGHTSWKALEDGLGYLLPRPLARFLVLELRLWAYLYIWVFRRYRPSANAFPYLRHSSVGVLLLALGFSAPVEFLLYEALIPWPWVRVLLLIIGVYTIFWALAFVAALHVLPHECLPDGVLARYGIAVQAFVPYTAIEHVVAHSQSFTGRPNGFRVNRAEQSGAVVVGGLTQVTLTLSRPVEVQTMFGRSSTVTLLKIAADQPEALVACIREHLHVAVQDGPR